MNAPVYCTFCGGQMLLVNETLKNGVWESSTNTYVWHTEDVNYLFCPVCDHRIPEHDFDSDLTEEQKGGVQAALR